MSGRARVLIPANIRENVLTDGFGDPAECEYCGYFPAVAVDHIMPWSRGGSNDPTNLAPACRYCNTDKSDLTVNEWRAWREEQGKPWPPPSPTDAVNALVSALVEHHPEAAPEFASDGAADKGAVIAELWAFRRDPGRWDAVAAAGRLARELAPVAEERAA